MNSYCRDQAVNCAGHTKLVFLSLGRRTSSDYRNLRRIHNHSHSHLILSLLVFRSTVRYPYGGYVVVVVLSLWRVQRTYKCTSSYRLFFPVIIFVSSVCRMCQRLLRRLASVARRRDRNAKEVCGGETTARAGRRSSRSCRGRLDEKCCSEKQTKKTNRRPPVKVKGRKRRCRRTRRSRRHVRLRRRRR